MRDQGQIHNQIQAYRHPSEPHALELADLSHSVGERAFPPSCAREAPTPNAHALGEPGRGGGLGFLPTNFATVHADASPEAERRLALKLPSQFHSETGSCSPKPAGLYPFVFVENPISHLLGSQPLPIRRVQT